MIAPPLLASLIGQDVAHHRHYLPLTYAVYGAAAMLALLFIRETGDVRWEDLDTSESSHLTDTGTVAIGTPEM
jgi:hypothetical protein